MFWMVSCRIASTIVSDDCGGCIDGGWHSETRPITHAHQTSTTTPPCQARTAVEDSPCRMTRCSASSTGCGTVSVGAARRPKPLKMDMRRAGAATGTLAMASSQRSTRMEPLGQWLRRGGSGRGHDFCGDGVCHCTSHDEMTVASLGAFR